MHNLNLELNVTSTAYILANFAYRPLSHHSMETATIFTPHAQRRLDGNAAHQRCTRARPKRELSSKRPPSVECHNISSFQHGYVRLVVRSVLSLRRFAPKTAAKYVSGGPRPSSVRSVHTAAGRPCKNPVPCARQSVGKIEIQIATCRCVCVRVWL